MMIHQLIYTSRLAFDSRAADGWATLADIVVHARKNNSSAGVTGFLVTGSDWAAQILEGDSKAVTPIFQRILRDPRHHSIRVVDMRLAAAPQFSAWSMGLSGHEWSEVTRENLSRIRQNLAFETMGFEEIIDLALGVASSGSVAA